MPKTSRGILVVFDGIDGAGKTTQVGLLAEALQNAGLSVKTSKEPTDGTWGRKIRESAFTGRMPIKEELAAFIKDREEHISTLINPALDNGEIVILDRYYYSTICYQGARGEDKDELRNSVMESAIVPDISFIMDIDPEISQVRIAKRDGQPNEFEAVDELKKVRENYDWLCHRDKELYELDSIFPIDVLHYTIMQLMIDTVLRSNLCATSGGCEDEYYCSFRMTNTCEWQRVKNEILNNLEKPKKYPALKYHSE